MLFLNAFCYSFVVTIVCYGYYVDRRQVKKEFSYLMNVSALVIFTVYNFIVGFVSTATSLVHSLLALVS